MPLKSTRAFVIGSFKYGEADSIIHFFTKDEGKISTIARNVRRAKKRSVGSFDLLSFMNITYFEKEGKEIFTLSSAEPAEKASACDQDLKTIAYISAIVELVREFCPAGQANQDIYQLLCWAHKIIQNRREDLTTVLTFALKLLDFSGFGLRVDVCDACRRNTDAQECFFSTQGNVIICSTCKDEKSPHIPINRGMIKFIEKVRSSPLRLLDRIKLSKTSSKRLFDILESYIQSILQKSLKTSQFLREISLDL